VCGLAGCAKTDRDGTMAEIKALIEHPDTLNHFELGGYALKAVYSDMSDTPIDRDLLVLLVKHSCYPGRSILGDLMLNLVYQHKSPRLLLPPDEGANHRFWRPIWRFVEYDVNAVHAAEYVNSKTPFPPAAEPEYHYRNHLAELQANLIRRLDDAPALRAVVRDYFTIGAETDRITDDNSVASEFQQVATRDPALFRDVLSLLYGHPLWSVAESAASLVAELIREAAADDRPKHPYIRVVTSFLDPDVDLSWRMRYGAMETAYQIRLNETPTMATFGKGVKDFYADPVSKLRGLCAENLFSVILNASDHRREQYEKEFGVQIRRWLQDDDCWVLDHVHRYFHTLHGRGVDVGPFTGSQISPLFAGLDRWWEKPRTNFLEHIERTKKPAG
jgi:hypothetical protein